MSNVEQKDQGHVIGGYKATLTNPNTSDEAKKHAEEMLAKLDNGATASSNEESYEYQKHKNHVIAGYKGALTNANTSEEARKHAQMMLDKLQGEGAEHDNRVLGGYKATLTNPNTSEEAKRHAREMLAEAGLDDKSTESMNDDEKHRHHVLGGYKATLKNANASEEAKKHAQEMIDNMGKDASYNLSFEVKADGSEHDNRVLGGYKATLSNPNSSEEAKEMAQKVLDDAGVDAAPKRPASEDLSEEEKHRNHVMGGYKATLSNPNSSEEAKKHAQEELDRMEKGESGEEKGTKRSADEISEESGKGKQGFASMPKEKVQEIASKGGRTLHAGEEPIPKKGKTEESGKASEHKSTVSQSSAK